MPPLPNVPNVIRCDLHWQVGVDANALSRFYFSYTGSAPSSANLNSLCTSVRNAWTTDLQSFYNATGGLLRVVMTDLSSDSGAQGTDLTAVSGTRSGNDLPNATAVLFNHVIARRYRGGKPRSYIPFLTTSDLTTGVWTTSVANSLQAAFTSFIAAVIGASAGSTTIEAHVNVSFYNGFTSVQNPVTKRYRNVPTIRSSPLVDTITATTVNPKPGNQRRRALHSS